MKRKFLASLLAVCMALSLLPVTARAAEVASGTCGAEGDGSNLTWTLDDAGTLTISGTGAMENFTYSSSLPWDSNRSGIQTVTIGEGVTSIGDRAFISCSSLTSVTIPGSVSSIGDAAFYNCNNLTSVTIPDSVSSIGDAAFSSCDNLTSVTIPGSVTSIGASAFAYCSGLTSVTIQEGVASIGDSAFRECINLEYVSIPGSINRIEDGAFERWYSSADPSVPIECKYYYGGSPDQWLAIDSEGAFGDAADSSLMAEYYCCFFPTLTCDDSAIKYGTADPTVTITSDTAFKADVSAADIKLTANTVGLTLASVSLDQTTRAGDNKTLTLQFSGTVQAGDLNITVLSSAFSVPVATAEAPGGIDTAMPPIAIGAPPVDPEPTPPVDPAPEPPVEPAPEPGPGPAPGPVFPAPPSEPAPAPESDKDPEPDAPQAVYVEDTLETQTPPAVTVSGTGESPYQDMVKSGEYADWIDRLDLPQGPLNLYKVLCIGGDGDALYDLLINDEYFRVVSRGGGTGEAVDVESVLELVSRLDAPLSSGDGIFSEDQFTGGFDTLDTTAGDRAIDYAGLKEGDLVRTSSFNGIFVSKLAKDGNDDYDEDLKRDCAYAHSAFQAFDRDHPEVFWLSGKSKLRILTVTMQEGGRKYKESYIFFVLADKDGFTIRDDRYPSQNVIESDIQRRDAAVEAILKTVTAQTPHEQAAQLNRWLTEHNEYNTSSDLLSLPNWPHECLSALTGSVGTEGPVCDGYARAFKVLCGELGIPCVLVDGYAKVSAESGGEFHMWNSAQMPDGKWYGVDVTWNDPRVKGVSGAKSGHEREDFLLVGADTVVLGLKFSVSHPPKNRAADGGVAFVNGPALSAAAFNPLAGASVLPFRDVAAGAWYYGAVAYVYENDLMTGAAAGLFQPDAGMTRQQLWMVLARLSGESPANMEEARNWAVSAAVSDGSNPGGAPTRQQLAAMLCRFRGPETPPAPLAPDAFPDAAAVADYAREAMAWAVSAGILRGTDRGELNPDGSASRAQFAAILQRLPEAA